MNGYLCKNPKLVTAIDFFKGGFNIPKPPIPPFGSAVTLGTVNEIPGLNTLGISFARTDHAPNGGPCFVLFSKVLNEGDVFLIPEGLVHVQVNVGNTTAVVYSGFNSQNPGAISIPSAVFGSKPSIDADVLARAFQVDVNASPICFYVSLQWNLS